METYRIEVTVSKEKTISLKDLPFTEGDKVEILVCKRIREADKKQEKYPLRGLPIRYKKPLESVAENDWAVLE